MQNQPHPARGSLTARSWFGPAAAGVAYFAAAEVGHFLSFPDVDFATFWPPFGIYFFALMRISREDWWKLFIATLLANQASDVLFHEKSVLVSLGFWMGNSLAAVTAVFAMHRLSAPPFNLASLRQLLFLNIAASVGAAVSACAGYLVIRLFFGTEDFIEVWSVWWASDFLGLLVTVPLLLTWVSRDRPVKHGELPEFFMILFCVAIFASLTFSGEPGGAQVSAISFPVLAWASLRFGLAGAAAANLILICIAVYATTRGHGSFASETASISENARLLQFFMLASIFCSLPLGILIQTRQRLELEMRNQRNLLQSILDSTSEGVIVANAKGEFVLFNPSAQRLLRRGPEPVPMEQWATAYSVFTADGKTPVPAGTGPLSRAIRGENTDNLELIIRPPNGAGDFWVSASGRPILDSEGGIAGGVAVFRDITQKKQREADRERLIVDLQQALQEIRTLRGILPICAHCKKIRTEVGGWESLEEHVRHRTTAKFSHGICPDCARAHFGEFLG